MAKILFLIHSFWGLLYSPPPPVVYFQNNPEKLGGPVCIVGIIVKKKQNKDGYFAEFVR